jgi:hypothetical protein
MTRPTPAEGATIPYCPRRARQGKDYARSRLTLPWYQIFTNITLGIPLGVIGS